MAKIYNRRQQKDFRRSLRRDLTEAEQKLWFHLKGKQLGVKFRRQHGIGLYIVDFFCPEARLVIEVDGDSHYLPGAENKDRDRQAFIEAQGVRCLRFTNMDIKEHVDSVLETIQDHIGNPS